MVKSVCSLISIGFSMKEKIGFKSLFPPLALSKAAYIESCIK